MPYINHTKDVYLTATAYRKFAELFFNPSTGRIATFVVGIRIVFFLNYFAIAIIISHYSCFRVALVITEKYPLLS